MVPPLGPEPRSTGCKQVCPAGDRATLPRQMRILLNATSEELDRLGGDFTHYRDWLRLSRVAMSFELVPPNRIRRWQGFLRKVAEKATRTWQPDWIRRRLFLLSRYLYLPQADAANADLIFSHLLFPLAPPQGVPVVWNSQGISPARYYETVNRGQWTVEDVAFVYRQLGRRADAVVVFTQACACNVVQWCSELKEKTFVVPAPVFVEAAEVGSKPSLQDGVLRLLFVGLDARRKGLLEVLEAYRKLIGHDQRVELHIVSRPTWDLQRVIATLKNARLHLSSPGIDVKRLMANADVFLLPTHADTYALAAVEAMAHGCAVIISDLEPLPEVIPEGEVGFSVPAGNSGALYEKLARLVSDSRLLRRLQRNARDRYLRYHAPDVVAGQLERLFLQIKRRRQGEGGNAGSWVAANDAR